MPQHSSQHAHTPSFLCHVPSLCQSTHLSLLGSPVLSDLVLQRRALVLAEHSEHTSNALAHNLDLRELVWGAARDLGHTQGCKLALELLKLSGQLKLALGAEFVGLDFGCKVEGEANTQPESLDYQCCVLLL